MTEAVKPSREDQLSEMGPSEGGIRSPSTKEEAIMSSRSEFFSPMSGRLSQADTTDGYTSLCYVIRNFLAPIVPLHRELEFEKQELAKRPDFTLTAAFQRFTASVHAKLSEQDIYFGF